MIFFDCPDNPAPIGGIKQIYRHVDILHARCIAASVVHASPGFRCDWFENDTPILYGPDVQAAAGDVIVLPESRPAGVTLRRRFPGVRQAIFNQNAYLTFKDADPNTWDYDSHYRDPETTAIVTVSADSASVLRFLFPDLPVMVAPCGVDTGVFEFSETKEPLIAFVMRKNKLLREVINGLRARGSLAGWSVAGIAGHTEREVAAIMRRASIFLTATSHEGFSLPPAEAMASGCIVVGYDGRGGREYFDPSTGYPVADGDIVSFIETVERVMREIVEAPGEIAARRRGAAATIGKRFGRAAEADGVAAAWEAVLQL